MATKAIIPNPKTLPLIGNLHQIPKAGLIQHLMDVARDFADPGIFKLYFGSYVSMWVSHPDLVAELSDEARFRKIPGPGLRAVRSFAGDGLFTAFSEEPNWAKAHNILMPAFSQRAMRGYYDMMVEVADALIAKWSARAGEEVNVPDDMTRFTLDSIAIAGFGYRFNSFEKEALDPFLESLATALIECMNKTTRLPIQQRFAKKSQARLAEAIATMNALVDEVIAERRAHPTDGGDLLNLMLTAKDPESGEGLTDLNIRYQILTFLIAGHETTSGMLSFAFYQLLRHPHILAQAYAEVDRVLPGDKRPDYADIAKLDVIERILKETLRLWPTAPSFSVGPHEDEVIGGLWTLRKDRPVNVMTPALHRHPSVWERPYDFDIDRWLPEAEAARHPHAYKPFGNGVRACIGRQFAMVEAKLALAMLLQKFAISDRRDYALTIKETLSIKPDNFTMRVDARAAHSRLVAPAQAGASGALDSQQALASARATESVAGAGRRLSVLWGSSLGTARDIAEEIAERAEADGFEVRVRSIDESLGTLPEDRVVVVVTATYNGKAPDSSVKTEAAMDAGHFDPMQWPETKFAVLGIGSSNWPNYQAFPRRVDAAFEATGAQRLVAMGQADTEGDFDAQVAGFLAQLWQALGAKGGEAKAAGLSLTMVDTRDARAAVLPDQAVAMEIVSNTELVTPVAGLERPRSSTRLIRVALPEGTTYNSGDHIAIYAKNPKGHVDMAIERLGVPGAMQLVLSGASGRFRHLPLGRTVTVRQLLTDFVEIQDPLPKRALEAAIAATRCPDTLGQLRALSWEEIAETRLSLLGLLLKFPAIEMDLEAFVELSSAIAPRFYSIASSPLVSPDAADLIVGTMRAPAWSGVGEHQGFASSHMRDLAAGEAVFGYVRAPNPPFAPPVDPQTPMILIGPGTGFAPFRAFLEERESGGKSGPIHLFYGCKHPDHDWLCRDQMERWHGSGLIQLHLAHSAVEGYPHAYVQHAVLAAADQLWPLLDANAQIFVCGDGRNMAPAVREALIDIHEAKTGGSRDEASAWLEGLIDAGRYHQDVYGFGK